MQLNGISRTSRRREGVGALLIGTPSRMRLLTPRVSMRSRAHRRGCIRHDYHGRYLTFREPAQAGSNTSSITEFDSSGRDLSYGQSTSLSVTYSHVPQLKEPLTSGSNVSRRTPEPRNAGPEQSLRSRLALTSTVSSM
jgi:hypothetical protein